MSKKAILLIFLLAFFFIASYHPLTYGQNPVGPGSPYDIFEPHKKDISRYRAFGERVAQAQPPPIPSPPDINPLLLPKTEKEIKEIKKKAEASSYAIPISEETIPHYAENRAGTTVLGFPEYVLGAGDQLAITMWLKSKGQTSKILVQQNGNISFLFVENLRAVGKTPSQLDEELTKKLQGYVRNPKLDIVVIKYNSKKITLIGEIERMNTPGGKSGPGTYKLIGQTRVVEMIMQVGGFTAKADLAHVEVTRQGRVYGIDLSKAMHKGDLSQNIILENADTILVPTLPIFLQDTALARKVFVLGDVQYPGRYEFKKDIRVIEAISLARGITREADTAAAKVLRGQKVIPVDVNAILNKNKTKLNIWVNDGDIVFIPKLTIFEEDRLYKKRFYVTGGVLYPKMYEFQKNMGPLDAVAMGGGFIKEAFEEKSFIVRQGKKIPVNFKEYLEDPSKYAHVKILDGDIMYVPKQYVIAVAILGEVVYPGQYEIKGDKITLAEAIATARGPTKDAIMSQAVILRGDMRDPEIIEADMDRYFKKRDLSQNPYVREGDVVYIPRTKIASFTHFMSNLGPILQNFLYPGLYRNMYTTGGGMRFDTGFPVTGPSESTQFPTVGP